MAETKCPLCGSESFYVKDPVDEFEIYEFDLKEDGIVFDVEVDESELPELGEESETYCNKCAWHGKLKMLTG